MRLFNSIVVVGCILLGIPWTLLIAILVLLTAHINYYFACELVRWWAIGWCRILGIRITVLNPEHLRESRAFVLAPNHQSNADILVLSTLPVHALYLSKRQVSYIPFVGWAMTALGNYWVRRDHSPGDLLIMKNVEEGLKQGKSVVIFPEGTRTRTGKLGPFKKGAFRTSINSGVPLCPIAITGTFAIAPAGQLPSRRGFPVTVRIGKPYYPKPKASVSQVMDDYRNVLIGLLELNKTSSVV